MPVTEGTGSELARLVRERRDTSPAGRARWKAFDESLKALRDLGFQEPVVEFYRKAARTTGMLPHEVCGTWLRGLLPFLRRTSELVGDQLGSVVSGGRIRRPQLLSATSRA